MNIRAFLLLGALLLAGQLVASRPAAAQVIVRVGPAYCAPRAYYGRPRYYYPPSPAVVYAVPPRVAVPAPYYAPRPYYYAPRPHGYRGRYGRRW